MSFAIAGVFGRSRLRVSLPDGWVVKSAQYEGRDILDTPIEMRSGEAWSGVQVIITDRVSTVAGHVSDEKRRPAVDGTIVVFAVDAGKWTDGSRYVRSMRTDQGGSWLIKGLPPGDYFAIALDYVEDGMWNDPDYLGSLQPGALKFAIGEGEAQTLSLKLVAPDRP